MAVGEYEAYERAKMENNCFQIGCIVIQEVFMK